MKQLWAGLIVIAGASFLGWVLLRRFYNRAGSIAPAFPTPAYESEEALLDQALELAGPARQAFLERAGAGRPELRRRLEELIEDSEAMGDFLGEGEGSQIGHYLLVEEIGRGGFGSVWKAHQIAPFERMVALKILNPGMNSAQVKMRFDKEQKLLAKLAHPNIAAIFDAGISRSGRPYFVMELVPGSMITEYCDRHGLSIAERLRLFLQVCDAIQHAHEQGVIHRDIKPSNVLVNENDGQPRVIDFGIAKATDPRESGQTPLTQSGQRFFSLGNSAPEQVLGLDTDFRSDVYSLGALLYELLAGRPPLMADQFQRIQQGGALHLAVTKDLPSPRRRLQALDRDELLRVAQARGLSPARLLKVNRRLDSLVMRCLERKPEHRFESARTLIRCLEGYLGEQRVPTDPVYRFRRLIRRNQKFAVAAAATILAALAFYLCPHAPAAVWEDIPLRLANLTARGEWVWSNFLVVNVSECWLGGGYDQQSGTGQFTGHGVLTHTDDGGEHWHQVTLTNSDAGAGTLSHFLHKTWSGIGPVEGLNEMVDYQPNGQKVTNLWIATTSGIFATTNALDAAPSWRRLTPPPDGPEGYSYFTGLTALDNQRECYAYGWQGIACSQSGRQWRVQLPAYDFAVMDLCVADPWRPEAWAVSNGAGPAGPGRIYHLSGPGGKWEPVPLSPSLCRPGQTLNAVIVVRYSTDIVVVGAGGLILRSHEENHARVWQSAQPVATSLYGLAYDNNGCLWTCGDRGVLLKSSNGGKTWGRIYCFDSKGQPLTEDLIRLQFDATNQAWALGKFRLFRCRTL